MTTTNPVIEKIEQFCDVLRTNYQSSAIERHRYAIKRINDPNDSYNDSIEWHQNQIDKLAMGENVDQFIYTLGKKYAKIIHITYHGEHKSSHAFVDLKTGDVYKSASWNAPAKGIRYNLMNDQSRQEMYQRADWAGGYLYAR